MTCTSADIVPCIGLCTDMRVQRKRQAVEAVYESRAMPEDHKVGQEQGPHWHVGQ
jgi:hypothetical protein